MYEITPYKVALVTLELLFSLRHVPVYSHHMFGQFPRKSILLVKRSQRNDKLHILDLQICILAAYT